MKYDIAFDLYNTLCTSIRKNHPEDILKVQPKRKMLHILKELKSKGHRIIIFTRRDACGRGGRALTIKWLDKHNVPYDELITEKPHFDILIDDRTANGAGEFQGELIQFGTEKFPNLEQTLKYLLNEKK